MRYPRSKDRFRSDLPEPLLDFVEGKKNIEISVLLELSACEAMHKLFAEVRSISMAGFGKSNMCNSLYLQRK